MAELWDDEGPISQGKILTAILKGNLDEARHMLAGWSTADLYLLARAARTLEGFCTKTSPYRP